MRCREELCKLIPLKLKFRNFFFSPPFPDWVAIDALQLRCLFVFALNIHIDLRIYAIYPMS